MRAPIVATLLILAAGIAFADTYSVTTAVIEVTITNQPPEIAWMELGETYEGMSVSCNATATDREQDDISYAYRWYKNNQEIGYAGKELPPEYYNSGDTVACEATPYDRHANGTSGTASTYVKEVPFGTATVKTALLLAGSKTSTNQVAKTTQKGLLATTGFLVKEVGNSAGKTPVVVGIVVILLFVNVNLIFRLKRLKATY